MTCPKFYYVDPPLAINNSKYRGSTSTIQFFLVSESVSQLLLVTDQSRFMTSAASLSADIIKQNIPPVPADPGFAIDLLT